MTATAQKPRITPPPPMQLILPASAYREENQIYWDKRRSAEAAVAPPGISWSRLPP